MKHAVIINVHKGYEQLKILISQLSFADVFIHVDKKAENLFVKLSDTFQYQENLYFIKGRIDVNWSGFSQVQAILNLLKSVQHTHKEYDYIHYISGQDLLLIGHEKLDKILMTFGNKCEFINYEAIGKYTWRVKNYSFFRENKNNRKLLYRVADNMIRIVQIPFKRRNLQGFKLYKGSSWFSITQECMDFILSKAKDEEFIKQFKYTACSDEHFFQILILNSPFVKRAINNNLRFVEFQGLKASPRILTMEDLTKFMDKSYIFARKFDSLIDRHVMEVIIQNIEGKHTFIDEGE